MNCYRQSSIRPDTTPQGLGRQAQQRLLAPAAQAASAVRAAQSALFAGFCSGVRAPEKPYIRYFLTINFIGDHYAPAFYRIDGVDIADWSYRSRHR
jgi:hypothetical protein